jgi:hypothetical protein
MPGYEVLDSVLAAMRYVGPELRNGLTNHAPMTVEALCALNRADAVAGWDSDTGTCRLRLFGVS